MMNREVFRCLVLALLSGTLLAAAASGQPFSSLNSANAPAGTAKMASLNAQGVTRDARRHPDGSLAFIAANPGQSLGGLAKSGNAVENARSFLLSNREDFGLTSSLTSLEEERVTHSGDKTFVRMQQTLSGLPVFGAQTLVQLSGDGAIECVFNDTLRQTAAFENGTAPLEPVLDPDQASAIALAELQRLYSVQLPAVDNGPEAVILAPDVLDLPGNAALCWRVAVRDLAVPQVFEQIFINAETGALTLHYALSMSSKNRSIYDANNTSADPGTLLRSEGQAACAVTEANEAYDDFGDAYDFFSTNFGRDSLNDAGHILSATVRYCDPYYDCPYDNAYWDGTSRFYFGDGFAAADDVVAHEFTHGVTQFTCNLNYIGQSGAMNESFSDIFGEFVDLTNGRGDDSAGVRWLLGEDSVDGALRSMSNPPAHGCPDSTCSDLWWDSYYDNYGVHFNSGVSNKLCYLLTDGDTFNGETITGMGIPAVAGLFYECMTNLLTASSDFEDLGNALTQAAVNLGLTSTEQANVLAACRAVHITADTTCLAPPANTTCGDGALVCQQPHWPDTYWESILASTTSDSNCAGVESFSGLTNNIGALRWWGISAFTPDGYSWSLCDLDPSASFLVSFYTNASGRPGTLKKMYTVQPTATEVGSSYGGWIVRRYDVTLSAPLSLSSGWVRIQYSGDSTCSFYWLSSPTGDGSALQYASSYYRTLDFDLSLCLYTAEEGAVTTTIEPSGARDAGAQWRVDGGTWQNSAATVSALSVGTHTISYSPLTNWTAPADQTVTVSGNQTCTTTGTYTAQVTGSLQVIIEPSGARDAGAQWRVDGGAWQNSAATVTGLWAGTHTLSFSAVNGWGPQADQTVTVGADQTTAVTFTYTQQIGSLQVTIEPSGARDAGAQWRVDGGTWQNSAVTLSGLWAGSHTVSYSSVTDWDEPVDQTVTVISDQTTAITGTYTVQTGSIQTALEPVEARDLGARWRVDGGPWQSSSTIMTGLAVGSHTVSFKAVTGYDAPADQSVSVRGNLITPITGTYTLPTGSIQVTLEPSEARTGGAQWRVDGGTWQNSDATVAGLSLEAHTVSFKTLTGWNTPVDQSVTVTSGATLSLTGLYTQEGESLQVTIEPAAACSAGAAWRVDGGAWQDSTATVTGLSTGSHVVSYKAVTGWDAPAEASVTLSSGQDAVLTATYTAQPSSLLVTIEPSGARDGGARWRVDDGIWRDSGTTATGLEAGDHLVSYKAVSGWVLPATQSLSLSAGQTSTVTGIYVQQVGGVQVMLSPEEAVNDGAAWQIDGGAWQNSGATLSDIIPGNHRLSFKAVTGWNTPSEQSVAVIADQTTTVTGAYLQQTGSIQVTLETSVARTAGARWNVDGDSWQVSGAIVGNLALGEHAVSFKEIDGFNTPKDLRVWVVVDAVTSESAEYTCSQLDAPGNVTASDGSSSTAVVISWTALTGAGIQYRVFRGTSGDSSEAQAISGWFSGSSFQDTNAAAPEVSTVAGTGCNASSTQETTYTTYSYWVQARIVSGCESVLSASDTGYRGLASSAAAPRSVEAAPTRQEQAAMLPKGGLMTGDNLVFGLFAALSLLLSARVSSSRRLGRP